MTTTVSVRSSVRGESIALAARHTRDGSAAPPGLRVLRGRDQAPDSPTPGFILFDAHRQLGNLAAPNGYARRVRGWYDGARPDSGIWQFEFWESRVTDQASLPTAVHIDMWSDTEHKVESFRITGITVAVTDPKTTVQENGVNYEMTKTVYTIGQQTAEVVWKTHLAGGLSKFVWKDVAGVEHTVLYDAKNTYEATLVKQDLGSSQYEASFQWSDGHGVQLSGVVRHTIDVEDGGWLLDVNLLDAMPSSMDPSVHTGLEPETYFYYSLYIDPIVGLNGPEYLDNDPPTATGEALATPRYGGPDRTYASLAAVHRNHDELEPKDAGNGQLRRFLAPFGMMYDHVRGHIEALAVRNDALRVDMGTLATLGRGVGWNLDRTTPGMAQRNDVLFASEFFQSVGTVAALSALLQRTLPDGWTFKIHEFANNVFHLDAGHNAHWNLWRAQSADALNLTSTDSFANPEPTRLVGRPAGVLVSPSNEWMFWHGNSSGRREIWVRWPGQPQYPARRVMEGAPNELTGGTYTDESPAAVVDGSKVRLVWSSNRSGAWSIWTRTIPQSYNGGVLTIDPAEQVSDDIGSDSNPTVVKETGQYGRLWVFWVSRRRGRADIWARTLRCVNQQNNVWAWDPARRITTATLGDEMPCAVLDGNNNIILFWQSQTSAGSRLYLSTQSTQGGQDIWSPPVALFASDDKFSDEAPSAAWFGGKLRLFWHSNRNGRWQIWTSTYNGSWSPYNGTWSDPMQVTQTFANGQFPAKKMVDAKEPAAVSDGSNLRVYWRAQLRGEAFQSRTFDRNDAAAFQCLGTPDDWNHYTYESGTTDNDQISYGTVGVYFTLPVQPQLSLKEKNDMILRIKTFVEPFRPATVRIIWYAQFNAQ